MSGHDRNHSDADAREARAILERVARETEPQLGAGVERMVRSGRGHFLARDADQGDRIEVIGTRIGRLLGLAVFVVLVGLLLSQFGALGG